jgi:hypothetical protein
MNELFRNVPCYDVNGCMNESPNCSQQMETSKEEMMLVRRAV